MAKKSGKPGADTPYALADLLAVMARLRDKDKAEEAGAWRKAAPSSRLDDVRWALPARTRAGCVKRAAEVGFDWRTAPVRASKAEYDRRAESAIAERDSGAVGARRGRGVRRPALRHGEYCAPSRRRSEASLRDANAKSRVASADRGGSRQDGRKRSTLEEMDQWDEARRPEKS
jgi:hypothetical protein